MRGRVAIGFVGLFIVFIWLDGRAQTNAPVVSGAHRFEKVADGIFYATASGTMSIGSNTPVIVSGDEALVIDSETSPAAGRALVADLKAITSKPIRFVVDSHYHYDHAFGNQVFGPEVQIIGHDNTWRRLSTNETLEQFTFKRSLERVAPAVEGFKKEIAQTTDPQQKASLERQIANNLAYLEQIKEVNVTPPNVTFDQAMTLHRGAREIRLLYLGRGHTDTDVVLYLPKERIVCTGDLMESIPSYMGDSYPEEWIATLERLKGIDFDTVMPGHGVVFKGKTKITAFQNYLRDALTQVTALRKQGLSADDTAAKVDLTKYRDEFANIRSVGIDVAAVRRIYQLADHPEPAK
jgi:cyclase